MVVQNGKILLTEDVAMMRKPKPKYARWLVSHHLHPPKDPKSNLHSFSKAAEANYGNYKSGVWVLGKY